MQGDVRGGRRLRLSACAALLHEDAHLCVCVCMCMCMHCSTKRPTCVCVCVCMCMCMCMCMYSPGFRAFCDSLAHSPRLAKFGAKLGAALAKKASRARQSSRANLLQPVALPGYTRWTHCPHCKLTGWPTVSCLGLARGCPRCLAKREPEGLA